MRNKAKFAGVAVVFAALAGFGKARGIPSAPAAPPEELHYQASCSMIDSSSLDGYVSNLSSDTYLIRGEVRFKFVSTSSMSRPEILIRTDSVIPAGKTVRVARAQLTFSPGADESCRFSVKSAIMKQR